MAGLGKLYAYANDAVAEEWRMLVRFGLAVAVKQHAVFDYRESSAYLAR